MKHDEDKSRPDDDRRSTLSKLQKRKAEGEARRRGDDRNFSLEGLRFTALLSQLQALQAVQGLSEFKPKGANGPRFEVPADPKERAMQRQWLMFKADWLEAMLEDTIGELETMNSLDAPHGPTPTEED